MLFRSVVSFFCFSVLCLSLVSCLQDNEDEPTIEGTEFDCNTFNYPDTIAYISALETVILNPLSANPGSYTATPDGLALNMETGQIDVNASETGLKYKVTFTPDSGGPGCDTFLTIGGVNYLDGVYVLDQNQREAMPVYNGVVGLPLPCPDDDDDDDEDDEDDDDDDSSCDFDVENPTGQLLSDLGFEVSSKGVIDLLASVENGAFGATPLNGSILDVELFYQLPDLSALALNSLPLRFFYYDTVDDIPQAVLDDIEEKNALINELRSGNWVNFRTLNETRPRGKPRPPFVVIVGRLQ